jgi:hypothetical protein
VHHHQCIIPVRSLTTTLVHDLRRHLTLPRPSLDLLHLLPSLLLAMLFVTTTPFVLPIASGVAACYG